ncbi:unnamed protein product [Staurois parvus]|uniref:Secreted protein n=1 Tax=Staurois parvus TaxID=386267 RepID=A0ABN9HJ46_9NEOB|nr:unnamed protein product [Staurois parvus]
MSHFRCLLTLLPRIHTDSWPLPLYGLHFKLLTLRHSAMGPCTASSCCCQVQSVSWVPVRPPIAADFIARLCHVPLSGLLTLLVGSIL